MRFRFALRRKISIIQELTPKKKEFQEVFGFLLWMKLDGNPSRPAHNIPTPQTRLGRLQLIISNFDSSNVTFQRGVQCFIILLRDHIQTEKERAT
jgi:hypothetical protein